MARKTTTEKRVSVEEQIKQLEKQRNTLLQKEKAEERKMRTHRLCKRGGIVEKLLPDLVTLTDTQFDIFVEKVLLTAHTKRILKELATPLAPVSVPENCESTLTKPAEMTARAIPASASNVNVSEDNNKRQVS